MLVQMPTYMKQNIAHSNPETLWRIPLECSSLSEAHSDFYTKSLPMTLLIVFSTMYAFLNKKFQS